MLSIARTDVSRGSILDQTITTDTRTGNLLVALLAVLSTIGKRFSMHRFAYANKIQVRLICGILSRSCCIRYVPMESRQMRCSGSNEHSCAHYQHLALSRLTPSSCGGLGEGKPLVPFCDRLFCCSRPCCSWRSVERLVSSPLSWLTPGTLLYWLTVRTVAGLRLHAYLQATMYIPSKLPPHLMPASVTTQQQQMGHFLLHAMFLCNESCLSTLARYLVLWVSMSVRTLLESNLTQDLSMWGQRLVSIYPAQMAFDIGRRRRVAFLLLSDHSCKTYLIA